MPPRSPTMVGSAVDTIVWSSDASSITSSSAPKIRRTRCSGWAAGGAGGASATVISVLGAAAELGASALEPAELLRQLTAERRERLAALADQLELPLDEGDRRLDDPQTLGVIRAVRPAVAQAGPGLLGL